jgi:AraC-like DNA-binding protein
MPTPLGSFIDHWQVVAGQMSALHPLKVKGELEALLSRIPRLETPTEQILARAVLSGVLSSLVSLPRVSKDHQLLRSVVRVFTTISSPEPDWRAAYGQVTDRYLILNDWEMSSTQASDCSKVERALQYLESSFADAQIALTRVADHVGLSPWHLARMLKRKTGHGFVAHLRRCRVEAAQRLLTGEPRSSLKEIAAAVGFREQGQLTHAFRQHCGMTPIAFRSALRSRHCTSRA